MSALLRQMLADSPAGLWPLDEPSGTTAFDRSGFARNGTATGSVTPAAVGPAGMRAFDFSGGQVQVPYNAVWDSTDFTIEAWAAADTNASNMAVMARIKADFDMSWQLLRNGPAGTWLADVMDVNSSAWLRTTPAIPSLTDWHHIAMTVVNGTTTSVLYVDAVAVGTDTTTSGAARDTSSGPLTIGGREYAGAALPFDGRLAWCAYYPSALSADRIKAHYQAGIRSGVVVG